MSHECSSRARCMLFRRRSVRAEPTHQQHAYVPSVDVQLKLLCLQVIVVGRTSGDFCHSHTTGEHDDQYRCGSVLDEAATVSDRTPRHRTAISTVRKNSGSISVESRTNGGMVLVATDRTDRALQRSDPEAIGVGDHDGERQNRDHFTCMRDRQASKRCGISCVDIVNMVSLSMVLCSSPWWEPAAMG